MDVVGNPKTRKALEMVASGEPVKPYLRFGTPTENGPETFESLAYPQAHTFYARVTMRDYLVVAVS